MKKVVSGFLEFRNQPYEQRKELFLELASGQSPEVLFITCADSRIDPNLVTQTEPGDLFICRNAGNIVPPHSPITGGVTASIEYAVAVLGVKDIVVCGHSDCGAMKGALAPESVASLPHVADWLDHSRAAVEVVRARHGKGHADELALVTQENVLLQMQHLRTHPSVAACIGAGQIQIHGWVYDIKSGEVKSYDEKSGAFVALEERYASLISDNQRA